MSRFLLRTPQHVLTGGLAVLFLFPLAWAAVASISPQAGTAQIDGWGFGNYRTLADYQAGIGQYLLNSTLVSAMTVLFTPNAKPAALVLSVLPVAVFLVICRIGGRFAALPRFAQPLVFGILSGLPAIIAILVAFL